MEVSITSAPSLFSEIPLLHPASKSKISSGFPLNDLPFYHQNFDFTVQSMLWLPILLSPLLQRVYSELYFGQRIVQDCFHYGGSSAEDDHPCDPQADNSACCPENTRCDTNLHCTASDGSFFVGSCTNNSWENPACPFALSKSNIVFLNLASWADLHPAP